MLHTHSYIYHQHCIMFLSQYFSFPCQYHSTKAPYSFTHLPSTLYNISNCQRCYITHSISGFVQSNWRTINGKWVQKNVELRSYGLTCRTIPAIHHRLRKTTKTLVVAFGLSADFWPCNRLNMIELFARELLSTWQHEQLCLHVQEKSLTGRSRRCLLDPNWSARVTLFGSLLTGRSSSCRPASTGHTKGCSWLQLTR
jgi:hypothetical protein